MMNTEDSAARSLASRLMARSVQIAAGLMISLLILTSVGRCELASDAEMDQVCRNRLAEIIHNEGSWAGSTDPRVLDFQEISEGGLVLARCYTISPAGFIVVPVLKELPPLKAFSEDNALEVDQRHGIGALLRDVLSDRFEKYIGRYGDLDAKQADYGEVLYDRRNRRAWDIYTMNGADFQSFLDSKNRIPDEQVGPLLSTAWHQIAPYNNYCPMGDNSRCVVWCVATALAQILWYHQWPPSGFGYTSYLWNGDQSCGGSTPGRLLRANFSDRYGYGGTIDEIAEMSFEVGMAYNVDYGVCYSIGYAMPVMDLLPDNFGYLDAVTVRYRKDYTAAAWFSYVQEEINNDRPIEYLIYNHMIVADGWATSSSINYYHMNYGWGGSSNAWYALDNLYCGWEGCDPMEEAMFANIYPDRGIMFYADTIAGQAPLEINFTASSDRPVDNWLWDFGDGDSAYTQMPTHMYDTAGIYDVSLAIEYDDSSRTKIRTQYIHVLDDSLSADQQTVHPGDVVEISLDAKNALPLSRIEIPVKFDGEFELFYDSCSVTGCRTESFQNISAVVDSANYRLAVSMTAWVAGYSDYPYLEAGSGKILNLYFTVSPEAKPNEETVIRIEGYESYEPIFLGSIYGQEHDYRPSVVSGLVVIDFLCGDADSGGSINLVDATYMINYLYKNGPAPDPPESGDADGSGNLNLLDVTYLINFLYKNGPEPIC